MGEAGKATTVGHSLDLDTDEDGWHYSACSCGWISPPCPGPEEAAGFYGDHRTTDA